MVNTTKQPRPALRYHGGKWRLAPWIISQFPNHRVYTETFGGAASTLLRKERSYAEIYNDLDGGIVNVFRQIRDNGPELHRLLIATPFAREEFRLAREPTADPLEAARRVIIGSFMGFGSDAVFLKSTGFRANSNRPGTTPAHDWRNYGDVFPLLIERLRGVVIENRDAKAVMAQHDGADTLHYVDPPYIHSTRTDTRHDYRHEMTDEQHIELAAFLKTLKGHIIVSGYWSPLYDELFEGWIRLEKKAFADGAAERVECLWINPR